MTSQTRASRKRLLEFMDPEKLMEDNENLRKSNRDLSEQQQNYIDKIRTLQEQLDLCEQNRTEIMQKIEKYNRFREGFVIHNREQMAKIAEQQERIAILEAQYTDCMKERDKLKSEARQHLPAESDDNHEINEDPEVELMSAVKIRESVLHDLPKDNISLLVRRLVDILFTSDEQKMYSTTGKKGKTGAVKPPLPEDRFVALSVYVHKTHPEVTKTQINTMVNNKLRDTCLKK